MLILFVSANLLKKALDGVGCDKEKINDIFCSLANKEIDELRKSFEMKTGKILHDTLRGELGGEHEKLILKLASANRSEACKDDTAAERSATEIRELIKNGTTMMGGLKDKVELRIIEILTESSPAQCQAIAVSAGVTEKFLLLLIQ